MCHLWQFPERLSLSKVKRRLAHPQSCLQLFRKGVVHFPNFYKEGGGADGKFPLGESPAVRAVSAGRFGVPAVHSAHKSVLAARLDPERLVFFD